jgi:hypothetical protein
VSEENIMLRTPVFLGFPMSRRHNRRLLVAVTYATLLPLMAAVIVVVPGVNPYLAVWMCFILAYNVASRAILGRLTKDTVLPERRGGQLTSLRLAPGQPRGEEEPDEREVAVRNAAHFEAYRVLAMYSIIIWVALPLLLPFSLSASTLVRVLELLAMPLLAIALTLPQAVVLWTEPDVPE